MDFFITAQSTHNPVTFSAKRRRPWMKSIKIKNCRTQLNVINLRLPQLYRSKWVKAVEEKDTHTSSDCHLLRNLGFLLRHDRFVYSLRSHYTLWYCQGRKTLVASNVKYGGCQVDAREDSDKLKIHPRRDIVFTKTQGWKEKENKNMWKTVNSTVTFVL